MGCNRQEFSLMKKYWWLNKINIDWVKPYDIVITTEQLNRLLNVKHLDPINRQFNTQQLFWKTVAHPERWEDLHDNHKIALYRRENQYMNKVILKVVSADEKTYIVSSYITDRKRNIKKWEQKSKKFINSLRWGDPTHISNR